MRAPLYTNDDFTFALSGLFPLGRVWPRDVDTIQEDLRKALAPSYRRVTDAAAALLVDAFPSTAVNLLPEWELTLGLPDPCAGAAQTIQQRQQQVQAKISAIGGQSAQYYIDLLNTLGFTGVTISEYSTFRADISHADDYLYDETWTFAWLVTSSNLDVAYFSADISFADDPLYSITNGEVLICTINRYRPAHTIPIFAVAS